MWLLDELKKRKDDTSVAIIHRDNRVSYSELWQRSEVIAKWLNVNLSTDAPVIIYGDKDAEIIEIMVAALKTGRAYIPIDVTFPPERVKKVAEITKAEILFDISGKDMSIQTESLNHILKKANIDVLPVDASDFDDIPEALWVKGDDNCYILFTSGSTGDPKGVQISKNNILNFISWFKKHGMVDGTVALDQVSYSFDISVISLYIYLPSGISLYCIDKDMIGDFRLLMEHLQKSGISAWVSTPAFIEMCALNSQFDRNLLPKLDKITLIGETLTKKLSRLLMDKLPGVNIINGYGPTEGTVILTQVTITEEMLKNVKNDLPIGYMLDDGEYYIEEIDGQSAGKGELIVTTKSLSKGYYNNPEATKKNFFTKDGKTYYRTGDVVYEENGLLYFCGRKDFQIKLNGYRIELEDIAENINKINGVSSNVVIPEYDDGKIKNLAAFVKLKSESQGGPSVLSIRKELLKLVPSYMIPKKIFIVNNFPLNVNGKIDRKALTKAYL